MNRAISIVLIALLAIGIQGTSAQSSSEEGSVTVCVDWSTKQLKYSKAWKKCPAKMTPLEIGAGPEGPQGPQGPAGPAGPVGSVGPAGASGSSFNLANYPVLVQLEEQIANATCDKKWSGIIGTLGSFNVETNEFGNPVRNYQWAVDMADGCPYPYPEIFTEIYAGMVSNHVATTAAPVLASTVSQRPYTLVDRWVTTVTQMDVNFENVGTYHLCTSSDPQYAAFSMSQDGRWTLISGTTYRYQGPGISFSFLGYEPRADDRGSLYDESGPAVYFCGSDSRTSSGLAIKRVRWSFSEQFGPGPSWASVEP